ncbi:MAG: NAAT family transporter [Deltaproteobacteria bacterium]|nr:NAAT family transporter [Deltaproteobacteria bacterium]
MTIELIQREFAYLAGAFVTLFFIIDPLTTVPVYMTLTERYSDDHRRQICAKASTIALGILLVVAFAGLKLFELFGITLPAFQIAGGILLLIVGIAQVNEVRSKVSPNEEDESLEKDDITVFPLAMPLLAGPGAISTVILMATKASGLMRKVELVLAITACIALAYLTLRAAKYLFKLLGNTGLNLLSRIMGLLLTAMGVQFVINGARDILPLLVAGSGG